ncbi:MAG: DNA mismatch repair protein MutS, partial [Chlamydiae bacterium RIFCSPHIGHO2_12_FULL_27_8]
TKTAMGARLLNYYLKFPLVDIDQIKNRHEAVEEFLKNYSIFYSLDENLDNIRDLQRILTRIINKSLNPRDFALLRFSLRKIPYIKDLLKPFESPLLKKAQNDLKDVEKILNILEDSIVENPPLRISDGEIFKNGFNSGLDDLRNILKNSAEWIEKYQKKLRDETDIKNLKVGYTNAFGYYIDINRSKSEKVPSYFIRKQTLVNNERYITIELKEFEEKALLAEEKVKILEGELFLKLREEILKYSDEIELISESISKIDLLFSFAKVSKSYNYVKPKIDNSNRIEIIEGRHPIIENSSLMQEFIANNTFMDEKNQLFLITGPNMAGKSTYIRQVALIIILAQIGCFVPAKEANICIIDKLFSRIGASDDLSKGQSTFMVEMAQTANILNNATEKSLIILDEIGRGTSTFDGISIAWAVAEYLLTVEGKKAKTLFATHYFELTEMEKFFLNVKNFNVGIKENDDGIVFLRKIIEGSADKSYGIHVAKLAGLPKSVIDSAEKRLKLLENVPKEKPKKNKELSLFDNFNHKNVIKEIEDMDINTISPIKALQKLYDLKNKILKNV